MSLIRTSLPLVQAFLVALSFALLPSAASAESAPIRAAAGTVRATDGTAIAGAAVTLAGNGPTQKTRSDRTGHFVFAQLPPGTYTIAVSAPGYAPLSGQSVSISSVAEAVVNVVLPVAQVSSLTQIGQVTTNGTRSLSTNPAPTIEIAALPYAQAGVTSVGSILSNQLSTTVYPILGGGLNAPTVVALRGPDPSETLVDVDGHQVNNGSTGDFDISLLDPADLQSVEVVYGIAPSALYGPNTLGGALNVRTLEPTADPHTLFRLTTGSYGTSGETVQATGTADHVGYVFSYHRLTSAGELDQTLIPTTDGTGTAPVSNSLDATSIIGKLRYAFDRGAGFIGVTFRDQAVVRDLSATLSSQELLPATSTLAATTTWSNQSGTIMNASNSAYGVDLQLPLGPRDSDGSYATTAVLRHQTSTAFQTVNGPGAAQSPYLYNDHDAIGDDTLEIDHVLPHGSLSLKYALTTEGLLTEFFPGDIFADADARAPNAFVQATARRAVSDEDVTTNPGASQQFLSQTQRSLGLQYQVDPTSKLHYSFAAYQSNYTTFGRSIDPRFGFVWTPTASTAYRISAGSTFQSPQLPTFIVPPTLPPVVDGYYSIGNPNATAERATSYDIGVTHIFAGRDFPRLSLDLYRTDLHNGVATYYAPQNPAIVATPDNVGMTCSSVYNGAPSNYCLSYPVNVTREVYQGLELRGSMNLARHTTLEASYDIDSVYTKDEPATAADEVPLFQQSLGVPLHKATLSIAHDTGHDLAYSAGLLYEGEYNELDEAPYVTLQAGLTLHLRNHVDVGLYGTNLTNVYDFKFTRTNGGIAYGSLNGPIGPTDAYALAGRQIILSVSRRS